MCRVKARVCCRRVSGSVPPVKSLYIGGGIPPRILPFLQPEGFMHSFTGNEYREMLATIPVHVILDPKTALIGAAAYGREHPVAPGDRI